MPQRVQSQPSLVQSPVCGGAGYHSDGTSTGESESGLRDSECMSDGNGDCRGRRRKLAKLPREAILLSPSAKVSLMEEGEADLNDSHLLSELDSTLVAPDNATPHTGPAFEFDDKETWQSFNSGTPREKGKGTDVITGSSAGSSPGPLDCVTHTECMNEVEKEEQGCKPKVAEPASRAESLESIHSTSMGAPLYSSTPPVKTAVPCDNPVPAIFEQREKGEDVNDCSGDPLHEEKATASSGHRSGSAVLGTSTTSPTSRLTLVNQSQFYGSEQEPAEARVLPSDPPTASSLMSKLFPGLKKQPAAPSKGKRDSVGACMCVLLSVFVCVCVVCVCAYVCYSHAFIRIQLNYSESSVIRISIIQITKSPSM